MKKNDLQSIKKMLGLMYKNINLPMTVFLKEVHIQLTS